MYVRSVVREGYRIRSTSTLSSSYSDALTSRRTPCISSAPRGDRTTRQRIDRGSKPSVANSRLLQSNIIGAQEGRRFPPVFDVKAQNTFVVKEKFKMTSPRLVTNALHKGDWAVSIDLKDAYFHVSIHVRSRRLLRFPLTMDGELRFFQFRALPFGLTSAPRVFTKVILPVGQSAHMPAVCLLQYLDD